jgi:hypothetical protein
MFDVRHAVLVAAALLAGCAGAGAGSGSSGGNAGGSGDSGGETYSIGASGDDASSSGRDAAGFISSGVKLTVNLMTAPTSVDTYPEDPGQFFVLLDVTLENIGTPRPILPGNGAFSLRTNESAQVAAFPMQPQGACAYATDAGPFAQGDTGECLVVFEIPLLQEPQVLTYDDGPGILATAPVPAVLGGCVSRSPPDPTAIPCDAPSSSYTCAAGVDPEVALADVSCTWPMLDPATGSNSFCCMPWKHGTSPCDPKASTLPYCPNKELLSFDFICQAGGPGADTLDPSLDCGAFPESDGEHVDYCCSLL